MRSIKLPIAMVLFGTAIVVGCMHTNSNGSSVAAAKKTKAQPDAAPFTEDQSELVAPAWEVIKKIDYLPFYSWGQDCEERAQVMGIELTAAGIPANLITVMPTKGNPLWPKALIPQRVTPTPLSGRPGSWTYHVAVVFHTPDAEIIMDPAMADHPVTLDAWLDLISSDQSKVLTWYTTYADWAGPMSGGHAGSDTRKATLSAMPLFPETMMIHLTESLDYSISQEQDYWTAADKKEAARESARILPRMTELRDALKAAGRLDAGNSDETILSADSVAQEAEGDEHD